MTSAIRPQMQPRTLVSSSNVKSVGYDPGSRTLDVEYHDGGVYRYHGVRPDAHAALMKARSVGSHFASQIRDRHKMTRLPKSES